MYIIVNLCIRRRSRTHRGSVIRRIVLPSSPYHFRSFPRRFFLPSSESAFSSSSSRALHSSSGDSGGVAAVVFVSDGSRTKLSRKLSSATSTPLATLLASVAAASPFFFFRRGGGFRGGGRRTRRLRTHFGRVLPGRGIRAATVASPRLPVRTIRTRQPPLRGRGKRRKTSRLGLLLLPAERAGPVLRHLVLVHVPGPDSDGLADGTVRARRGRDDALGEVLAEAGGHRARGRLTRLARGVSHRGGARENAPRERDCFAAATRRWTCARASARSGTRGRATGVIFEALFLSSKRRFS